jgi:quercetin dioxygenase-like cupin family protein
MFSPSLSAKETFMPQLHEPEMRVAPISVSETFDFEHDSHPARVRVWTGAPLALEMDASHYIVVYSGLATINYDGGAFALRPGYYGVIPGAVEVTGNGQALIVSSLNYQAMALFGGPLEERGRLRYVDNCTNSLLLSPPVRGEPCLNFLRLPSATAQTPHTHPSLRVGLVFSGHGRCETPHGMLDLVPGTVFIIPPGAKHSFQSDKEDLRIVIYHPDSDSGPTHSDHTMLNRTFIQGVSARYLTELHTTEAAAQ